MSQEAGEAAVAMVLAVAEAVRDLGQVPSGELYAALMGQMSLATYERIIDLAKGAGLIQERNHLLIWIGPKKA